MKNKRQQKTSSRANPASYLKKPIVAVVLGLLVLVGIYILFGTGNNFLKSTSTPTDSFVYDSVMNNDGLKKEKVNRVHSLMKQYYAQNKTYPKDLSDLKTIFNIEDEELKQYSNPPFYFTSDGTSYEYYVKLNTGENFKGDIEGINKNLDASVWVDVDQIVTGVNIFAFETKRLPKTLDEITTLPNLSYFKLKNNPFTGKPYTYLPSSNGIDFTVSGILSDGSEYKKGIPIN